MFKRLRGYFSSDLSIDLGTANTLVANGFTKRLIESDKVDVLIGGTTTGATMAMAPLVDKASLPFISLAGAVVVMVTTCSSE